jgi:signal transduction histidine kinase
MADRSLGPAGRETHAGRATIALLVDHARNRRLLADYLSDEYAVIEPGPTPLADLTCDLCLVDEPSLRRERESIAAKKRAEELAFLPVLLLRGPRRSNRGRRGVWDAVDEVIDAPVDKRELTGRIDGLLGTRRLSVVLARRTERSEDRFRSLFRAAPDPVVVVGAGGTVREVNDAFARAFDVDPAAPEPVRITELGISPTETVERVLVAGDGDARTDVVEWERGDSEALIAELNADVVSGLDGTTERIGVFRDVTELKERERWLRRQNEHLKEFAGTVAHDLRNPLNIAQGNLELAREAGGKRHFDAIERSLGRMEQLVDEVLSLARRGQAVLDPSSVSLERVVRTAWSHVDTTTESLSVESDGELLADDGRLCELFENLFRNAVDHGGSDVVVRVGLLGSADGFYVEDSGPGIPEADHDHVFEAGYTTTDDGTGFGLSIVRQIADGHGWDVAVAEGDDGGARFEISGTRCRIPPR